jgi:hypothetical protein
MPTKDIIREGKERAAGGIRTWEKLVPGAKDFGLEEFGRVVGGEGLVDFEGCDLRGDWGGLVCVCQCGHGDVLCGDQPVMSPPGSLALVDRAPHRVELRKPCSLARSPMMTNCSTITMAQRSAAQIERQVLLLDRCDVRWKSLAAHCFSAPTRDSTSVDESSSWCSWWLTCE